MRTRILYELSKSPYSVCRKSKGHLDKFVLVLRTAEKQFSRWALGDSIISTNTIKPLQPARPPARRNAIANVLDVSQYFLHFAGVHRTRAAAQRSAHVYIVRVYCARSVRA